MKVAPAIRVSLTVLGAFLVLGAFVAVLTIGASSNPPPLHVAVAVRDLGAGERIRPGDYRIVDQVIDPTLARLYVQQADLPAYGGAVVVEGIRRGDPLNKIKLAGAGSDASLRRYALVLTNTDDVVMTLPVNPDVIPEAVSAGDFVNILFAGGAEVGVNQLPDPTQAPFGPSAQDRATTTPPSVVAEPSPVPTVTATRAVVLPLADLMLERVPVLDVRHQQVQNPKASGDGTDSPYIDGPISGVVVRVPREYQTLLVFAAVAAKLRFAIASPLEPAGDVRPQMGVDWKKYIDVYRWKEAQSLARGETLTQTLYPLYTPVAPSPLAPTAEALPLP
jgi:hypothetical protein